MFSPVRPLAGLPSSGLPHRAPTTPFVCSWRLPLPLRLYCRLCWHGLRFRHFCHSRPRLHPTRPDTSHRPSCHCRRSRRAATTRRRSCLFPRRSPPCTLCALSTGSSLAAHWSAPTPGPRRSLPRSSATARAGTCTPRRSARWSATPTPSAGTGTTSRAAIPTGA